jgi:hypothetical protein
MIEVLLRLQLTGTDIKKGLVTGKRMLQQAVIFSEPALVPIAQHGTAYIFADYEADAGFLCFSEKEGKTI